jgi:broad specificity phosphatase PhoE
MTKYWLGEIHNGQTLVIFGHGIWYKMLLMEVLGLDQIATNNLQIDNCSMTELEFGIKGWKLIYFNRVCQ